MIEIHTIETTSLGDRSYLAHDGVTAVVVDPQRDIDRVLDLTSRLDMQITQVVEDGVAPSHGAAPRRGCAVRTMLHWRSPVAASLAMTRAA